MMISSLTLLSILLQLAILIQSSISKTWRSTNPGGGGAFNSPITLSSGVWVVGSDLGGVYISSNDGKSWSAIGAMQGLTETHVSSLHALSIGGFLIGTENGIVLSTDTGRSMKLVYKLGSGEHDGGYVTAFTSSGKIVYASVLRSYNEPGAVILRSVDGGKTFQETGSLNKLVVLGMRVHPMKSNIVWAVTGDGRFAKGESGAYLSSNGGARWTKLQPDSQSIVIDVIYAYDADNADMWYMSTKNSVSTQRGKFWISNNNGNRWTESAGNKGYVISGIILADAESTNGGVHVRIVNSYYDEMWESINRGQTWKVRALSVESGLWSASVQEWGMGGSFQGDLQTIGYDPSRPLTVLWATSQFVYRSSDGGTTWRGVNSVMMKAGWKSTGLDNIVPFVVAPSEVDRKLVYVGYADIGLWRSNNNGKSWTSLNVREFSYGWNGYGGNTLTVLPDMKRRDVVWAHLTGDLEPGKSHLVRSTNAGETWTELTKGLPTKKTYIESLTSGPKNGQLWVVVDGDVYHSLDDGDSWRVALRCGDCVGVHYSGDLIGLVAYGPSGVFRTSTRSTKWPDVLNRRSLTLTSRATRQRWTDITRSEMKRRWTKNKHWLEHKDEYVGPTELTTRGSDLWVAVLGKGLYHTPNVGRTWSLVYENQYVRSVAANSKSDAVIVGSSSSVYSGGYDRRTAGVVINKKGARSADARAWVQSNKGLAYPFAARVRTSKKSKTIWCVSPGQGVMKRK